MWSHFRLVKGDGRGVSEALVLMSYADKATSTQQRHISTAQHRIIITRVNEKPASSGHRMSISLALHCMRSDASPEYKVPSACPRRAYHLAHMSDEIPVHQHSPALRNGCLSSCPPSPSTQQYDAYLQHVTTLAYSDDACLNQDLLLTASPNWVAAQNQLE